KACIRLTGRNGKKSGRW
ncbi:antitermination family protein, partial [Escherichia coli 95.0183]